MLKKIILLFIALISILSLHAQEWDNLKFGIDVGTPVRTASENFGILVNLEPKLQVSNKVFMGMRVAMAINSQTFENYDQTSYIIDYMYDHGFLSIIPTCDYYWMRKDTRTYVGAGFGPYSLTNYIDIRGVNNTDPAEDVFEIKVPDQIGFLFRCGMEIRRGRFGLEYNLVPKTEVEAPSGYKKIGTVNSSYLGLTAGWIIGD